MIAGSAELMARARVEKHRFGGAMRQAGIVAAAGLYALDHNVERLADDHARARRLAEGWAARGVPVDPDRVETNFVQVDVGSLGLTSAEAIERLAAGGRRPQRHGQARASCARSRTSTSTTPTSSARSSSSPAALELLARA